MSDNEIYYIDSVQLTVFYNDDTHKYTSINTSELYENSEPKKGGLFDRVWMLDPTTNCEICGKIDRFCPGDCESMEQIINLFTLLKI